MGMPLRGKWLWILIICLAGALAAFLIFYFNSALWTNAARLYQALQNPHHLKKIIRSYGAYSPVAYTLAQVMQVVLAPIPGGAVEFLGGYLFGTEWGFFYSMVGLFIGSWLAFAIARIFEKVAVEKLVSESTRKKFNYLVGHEGVILSLLLFLIPGFPKDALCYILGLTPMHTGIFLLISTVGRIPGTLMAVLQGAKAFDHQYRTFLVLLGFSTLIILVFYIYHDEIHNLVKKLKRVDHGDRV